MDGLPCVPQAGNEAVRTLFHMDVSNLRDGCVFSGALPSPEKQRCPGARDDLCGCHFCGRISDGELSEKERDLSLELCGMPVSL